MDFLKQIQRLTCVYDISNEQAACYLSNYEDGYICHKHNGGCKNIYICRKISDDERKTKIMPDEVLVSMEDQIIERFMDRLKGLLFSDSRIHKADAFMRLMMSIKQQQVITDCIKRRTNNDIHKLFCKAKRIRKP